jgi:LysR family carnitine catabolism transcriptional activator
MNGLPLTIAELKAFVMVARSLSFTHAASNLGITQPALSMTIRQVEAKFGATLFDRSTRSVKLSSTGALLHPAAERLIENFERTTAGMREIADGRLGRITIACPEGVAAHVVAPTLARFVVNHPKVMVSVHDGDAASVEQMMHSFGADFGVTGYWKDHPDFVFAPLTTDRCCVICPPTHPLAGKQLISLRDLDNVPIVALNRDAGVRRLLEATCEAAGIRLVVQFEVARVSTLIEMVAAGLCISVLTELSTPHNAWSSLCLRPLEGTGLSYPIGIVTRANRVLAPSAALFVTALREHFRVSSTREAFPDSSPARHSGGAARPATSRRLPLRPA